MIANIGDQSRREYVNMMGQRFLFHEKFKENQTRG